MAEAVVDRTPTTRFFCHKCSIEIVGLLPDYTCPLCSCGFIEELDYENNEHGTGADTSNEELSDMAAPTTESNPRSGQLLNRINRMNYLPYRYYNAPNHLSYNPPEPWRLNSYHGGRREMVQLENILQDFLFSLSRVVSEDGQPPVLFLGNPGDYAWGRDGLDTIVTRLLNQMDSTGPPPLPRQQIDEIPTANVTQSQVDTKLQCSVCWEDFKLDEPVRQLPCQHVYHAPCIVPWLKLHGTCPICRQSLGDQNSAEANQDTVGPSLDALFRAADESHRRTLSPSSSSTGEGSSDNSWVGF